MGIEEEAGRWDRFRRLLRPEDREIFEEMVDECRRYASEVSAGCFPCRAEGMFLAILFAHHKQLKKLQEDFAST
jgi:hypothetical protein